MFLKFHKSSSERKTKWSLDESLDTSKLDRAFNRTVNRVNLQLQQQATHQSSSPQLSSALPPLHHHLHLHHDHRQSPQQQPTQQQQNPFDLYQNCKDALEFMEPLPVFPPEYSSLAQSPPRFPIYCSENEGQEMLPSYMPTIYKLDKFLRKLEWVSPYDPSPTRHWKDVIMELNSTQLNIYFVENQQKNFVNHLPTLPDQDVLSNKNILNFKSSLTSVRDLSNVIQFDKYKILRKENLVKSYSLQHAKIGLALDYKKHKYALRLRCETEQFLIQFPDAESMIDWNLGLCLGRDNALDLSKRSMPHYRTVPRRRHRHRRHGNYNSHSYTNGHSSSRRNRERNNSEPDILHRSRNNSVTNFFHRRRAISNVDYESENKLRSRISSMLRHRSSSDVNNKLQQLTSVSNSLTLDMNNNNNNVTTPRSSQERTTLENLNSEPASIKTPTLEVSEVSTTSTQISDEQQQFYEANETQTGNDDEIEITSLDNFNRDDDLEEDFDFDDDLDDDDDDLDDDDDDLDDDEEAQDSIEEEEEEVADAISTIPPLSANYAHSNNNDASCSSSSGRSSSSSDSPFSRRDKLKKQDDDIDFKWYPEFDKLPSNKKILKDAIRCMSTLSTTDQWCGRNIVKGLDNGVLYDKMSSSLGYNGKNNGGYSNRMRFVKEYIVTSNGLVPLS